MKNLLFLLLSLVVISITTSFAQGTAGETAKYQYRQLIDMPTAGILDRGIVGINTEMLPYGTLIAKIEAGIFENLSFGLSYGGANIIGSGKPDWYPFPPGVNLRFRIMNESLIIPAITLGFDTQGKGEYFDETKRFAIKAPGLFAAVSKNFSFLGFLSLHGTVNYTVLENKDGDNFMNIMVGAEKTLGSTFSVLMEYNFALNDNSTNIYGKGKGYLNAGVRWSISKGVTVGLDLRDLLENKKWHPTTADRAVMIEILQQI